MIVELIGLPGSGKTTLAKSLAEKPEWTYIAFDSKRQVLIYFLLGCVRRPRVFLYGLWLSRLVIRDRYLLWNCYFVKYAKYFRALHSQTPYTVIDEGMHQNIVSYARWKTNHLFIERYLRHCIMPDMVVVLHEEQATLAARWNKRIISDHPVVTTMTDTERRNMEKALHTFIHLVTDQPGYTICQGRVTKDTIEQLI